LFYLIINSRIKVLVGLRNKRVISILGWCFSDGIWPDVCESICLCYNSYF